MVCSDTTFRKNSYLIETIQLADFYAMEVFTGRCFPADHNFNSNCNFMQR